jgi:flavin reductase (DIM6/NTAB) family NADH-FMN oxidoreductase RutF
MARHACLIHPKQFAQEGTVSAMDPAVRRKALEQFTYGLYVVGVTRDDQKHAVLVTWLTQVSFDPPLIAVALMKGALAAAMAVDGGVFSVNVPAADQGAFARAFIKPKPRDGTRLGGHEFYARATGAPIFRDALAFVECRVVDTVDRGDHLLVVGEVVEAGAHREGEPLTLRMTSMHYAG